MAYNYEYEKKLMVAFIGAGEHAIRNILPAFQYAPIELAALADHNVDRGLAVARQFGARRFYPNHKALIAKEQVDAIFIVAGPGPDGLPQYPQLAADTLSAGFHTWIDVPPCSTAQDIHAFTNACLKSHKYLTVGFRRRFAPAYARLAEIIKSEDFGPISSFSMRYPLSLPDKETRAKKEGMAPFLSFFHPYALLLHLFGECEGFSFLRSSQTGGAVFSFRYRSGIVGTLHLTAGQAATSPTERLEVVGQGANVIVEDGARLRYYRRGSWGSMADVGRRESAIGDDDEAPIIWEPDLALGRLDNKMAFVQGYVGCIRHFAERLLQDEPPRHGTLVEILHIASILDKIRAGQEGQWIPVS